MTFPKEHKEFVADKIIAFEEMDIDRVYVQLAKLGKLAIILRIEEAADNHVLL